MRLETENVKETNVANVEVLPMPMTSSNEV
jgi:hypothetical protein